MSETDLKEWGIKSSFRSRRPSPSVPTVRKYSHRRPAKRLFPEHWIAGAIVALAFANAVRLLTF